MTALVGSLGRQQLLSGEWRGFQGDREQHERPIHQGYQIWVLGIYGLESQLARQLELNAVARAPWPIQGCECARFDGSRDGFAVDADRRSNRPGGNPQAQIELQGPRRFDREGDG